MGRAKREMEEREAAQARRDQYLIEAKGYQQCVECQEMFIPKYEEIICSECFGEKMRKE